MSADFRKTAISVDVSRFLLLGGKSRREIKERSDAAAYDDDSSPLTNWFNEFRVVAPRF